MLTKICLIALFVCFTIVHCQNSFCLTADPTIDLIQTGTFASDYRLSLMTKDWTFQKTVSYKVPAWGFDVVATVAKFQGLDNWVNYFVFAVKTSISKDGNSVVFSIPGGNGWSLLAINYLITSRDDLAAGNWVLAQKAWSQYAQLSYLRATTTISRQLTSSLNYAVAVWISGITTRDLYFKFSFIQQIYTPETQSLFIEASYDSLPKVQADLIISYVIYPTNHQYLTFSTDAITVPSIYQLVGVSQFNPHPFTQKLRIYKHDLIACIDDLQQGNRCPRKCVTSTQCLKIPSTYAASGMCGFCSSTDIVVNGQCTQPCKSVIYNKCICATRYTTATNNKACIKNVSIKCAQDQIYNPYSGSCRKCPFQSKADPNHQTCLCDIGYEYNVLSNQCTAACLNLQQRTSVSQCQCLNGYIKSQDQCIKCDTNSSPSRDLKTCECNKATTWDINKKTCVQCSRNQVPKNVNGSIQCVCQADYFNVNNECTLCDPALFLVSNGANCDCRAGYFKLGNQCQLCDKSCLKCSGPTESQCLSCTDSSLSPVRGYCKKGLPCFINTYFDNGVCKNCVQHCILCSNSTNCQKCQNGYSPKQTSLIGTSCQQICGDGILLSAQCDDKNINNNDGCNQFCKVEPGWSCIPDQINRKSQCNLINSKAVQFISMSIPAYTYDGVIAKIEVKNLPDCATRNNCSQCADMLSVITDNSQTTATVIYRQNTTYQFYVQFKYTFQRVYQFNAIVQLSQKWSNCFSSQDMQVRLNLNIIRDIFDEPPFQPSSLTLDSIGQPV